MEKNLVFSDDMVDFALPDKEKPVKTLSHLLFALASGKFIVEFKYSNYRNL